MEAHAKRKADEAIAKHQRRQRIGDDDDADDADVGVPQINSQSTACDWGMAGNLFFCFCSRDYVSKFALLDTIGDILSPDVVMARMRFRN